MFFGFMCTVACTDVFVKSCICADVCGDVCTGVGLGATVHANAVAAVLAFILVPKVAEMPAVWREELAFSV